MFWIVVALVLSGGAAVPEQVTVSGIVEAVLDAGEDRCELCDACSDCRAVHLVIRARSGRIDAHMAPAWFLDRLEFTPVVGDLVRISGTRQRMPSGRGVMAYEAQVGPAVFKLRDEHGLPLWRRVLTDARPTACDHTGR